MTMTERPFAKSLETLRAAGMRPTRQRLALARLLFGNGEARHVTAEGLYAEAKAAGARIALATVYNTLRQFKKKGLLREIVVEPGRTYFDTNTTHHHHFYDERDKRLVDIRGDELRISNMPESPEGTKISRVEVVIRVN